MYYFLLFIMSFFYQNDTRGSKNAPRIIVSEKERLELLDLYKIRGLDNGLEIYQPKWEKIKKYHTQNNISYNITLREQTRHVGRPLTLALVRGRFALAQDLLNEPEIEVNYQDENGNTLLHMVADYISDQSDFEEKPYKAIIQKLIQKGCPVNALDDLGRTALGYFCQDWKGSYQIFIENGALLMVKDKGNRCNVLDDYLEHVFWLVFNSPYRLYNNFPHKKVAHSDKIIKDLLCNTFNYDYRNYCTGKECFTLALVFKRLNKEKKIIMPKVLINYITKFVDPQRIRISNPVGHIEEALQDGWSRPILTGVTIKKLLEQRFQYLPVECHDLIKITTVGAWRDAWNSYQSGDRGESNLVVRALKYNPK